MRGTTFDYEVYMTIDDEDFTVRGEATYYPGRPGKYYGPPEQCYEDEPAEVDIESETWYYPDVSLGVAALPRELTGYENDKFYEKVFDYCASKYEDLCDQRY